MYGTLTDNFSKVDGFIVVHAGPGGEQTGNKNDIWSVKWVLPNERTVDGANVLVRTYVIPLLIITYDLQEPRFLLSSLSHRTPKSVSPLMS